jgi:hypothetical protein
MPRMNVASVSIPANTSTLNLLAGLSYEFLPQDAHLVIAANAAATGIQGTFLVGNGITVLDDQPIGTANRWPILPDDILFEDDVPAGRMLLRFRNTTGAAVVLNGAIIDVTFS